MMRFGRRSDEEEDKGVAKCVCVYVCMASLYPVSVYVCVYVCMYGKLNGNAFTQLCIHEVCPCGLIHLLPSSHYHTQFIAIPPSVNIFHLLFIFSSTFLFILLFKMIYILVHIFYFIFIFL